MAYLEERKAAGRVKKNSEWLGKFKENDGPQGVEEILLSPEDEAALDRAWEKLEKEKTKKHAKEANASRPFDDTSGDTVLQSEDWSCGPAAIASLARFLGHDVSEDDAVRLAGSNPAQGTPPEAMLDAVKALGLDAVAVERMRSEVLDRQLILGNPVLVCLQALDAPAGGTQEGHWVAIVEFWQGVYLVLDPAHGEVRVPREELLGRWRDMDASGRVYTRFGIVVRRAKRQEE